jgi:hypothetical protein
MPGFVREISRRPRQAFSTDAIPISALAVAERAILVEQLLAVALR